MALPYLTQQYILTVFNYLKNRNSGLDDLYGNMDRWILVSPKLVYTDN